MDTWIAAAEAACEASGALLRTKFRAELTSEMKPDQTIVTEADVSAERVMRAVLTKALPDHRVTGEELLPEGPADSRHEWVLDPIDGTIAFACGKAQFSTLIALLEDGVPILGIIDQPITGERWIGARGRATTLNPPPFTGEGDHAKRGGGGGRRTTCRTSAVESLADARLGTTDPVLFNDAERARFERLRAAARITSLGGDGYAYGLLASGHLDLIFESGLSRHDIAALVPVLLGAGAAACDAEGVSYDGRALGQGKFSLLAAATPALLQQALAS